MENLKKSKWFTALLLAMAVTTTSCMKENDLATDEFAGPNLRKVTITNSESSSVELIAGQTLNVGSVSFSDVDTNNDGEKDALEVTYSLTSGVFNDISFWIGSSESGLPVNRAGNPVVGSFPYKFNVAGNTTHTFRISFSTLNYSPGPVGTNFKVAAYASVNLNGKSEGAWGNGTRVVEKGNWAMWFNITISEDPETPPSENESFRAFAKGVSAIPVTNYLNGNGLWGWTNPLTAGTNSFDLYNKKGISVGTVTVVYENDEATIKYSLSGNYTFDNVFFHVGSTPLLVLNDEYTLAPGQMNLVDLNGTKSYTVTIGGLSGSIYFIGAASVYE